MTFQDGQKLAGRPRLAGVAVVALSLFTFACGGDDGPSESATGKSDATQSATTEDRCSPPEGDPLEPNPLPEKTSVTISAPGKMEAFAPAFLALEAGEFEKENLDVEFITTLASVQALATGEADAALSAPSAELINAVNAEVNLRWIAGNYTPVPDSAIGIYARTDVVGEDPDYGKLEGEQLSLANIGGLTLVTVDRLLQEEAGLEIGDVELVTYSPADALIGLENGAIAAGWQDAPFNEELIGSPEFVFMGAQDDDFVAGGLLAGEELLKEENCDTVFALLRAMERVIDGPLAPGYKDDPEAVTQLATLFELPEDAVESTEEMVFTQTIPPAVMDDFQDTLIKLELLEDSARLPDDQLVDRHYVEALFGEK